ncbi:MAG: DNA methyltransferase [Gammaproteobacteria bacterium]|nr:DNA methyltransferase [Gammaproteobacteria bacterium]
MAKFLRVYGQIPNTVPEGAVLDICVNRTTPYTHGFHKYPGKFIPHIPRWAIEKYTSENTLVVDPFCGSGTSLVEANLANRQALGIDIDPLSVLISKAKTSKVSIALLKKTASWLDQRARAKRGKKFRPDCETLEHWFSKDAIAILGRIRSAIDMLPVQFSDNAETRKVQDLWYVCFSSILRRASKADNQSQKTFVSGTHPKTPEDPMNLFCRRIAFFVRQMEIYMGEVPPKTQCSVMRADSGCAFHNAVKNLSVELLLTSPPYIKAIDYIYNQMVELFWIGDLFDMQTQKKQNLLKPSYIGNKQVSVGSYREFDPTACTELAPGLKGVLQKICAGDSKNGKYHAFVTHAYFNSMTRHMDDAARVLPSNKHYVMVLGNCLVSGVEVNVAKLMSQIAEKKGFAVEKKWGYKIKNRYMRFDRSGRGGIITHDWVLEMRRK